MIVCWLFRNAGINILRPSQLLQKEDNEIIGKEYIKNFDPISNLLLKRMVLYIRILFCKSEPHFDIYILDECKLWNSLNQCITSAADSFLLPSENTAKNIVSILWSLWTRQLACWHVAFIYIKPHWNKSYFCSRIHGLQNNFSNFLC